MLQTSRTLYGFCFSPVERCLEQTGNGWEKKLDLVQSGSPLCKHPFLRDDETAAASDSQPLTKLCQIRTRWMENKGA